MSLYPKKLRNLDDLEREKLRLRKKMRQLEEEEFLPGTDAFLGGKKKDGKKTKDGKTGIAALLDLLQFSNPIVSLLKDIVISRILRKRDSPKVTYNYAPVPEKKTAGILKKVAVEFIGGYLKWKAIELSYKGIRRLLKPKDKPVI